MIRYSWRRIYRKTGGSSKRIVLALKAIISTSLPKDRFDPIYNYYYTDFSGDSFLLDPVSLSTNSFRYSPKEIAQYIALASFRNYAYYRATKDASLELLHSPMSEDNINQNSLLRIRDGRVYFYYEESIKRRNNLWH